jgi:hypothetical protein
VVRSQAERVALVVEYDELLDPMDVSLLCANAVMASTDKVANLVEEFRHENEPELWRPSMCCAVAPDAITSHQNLCLVIVPVH